MLQFIRGFIYEMFLFGNSEKEVTIITFLKGTYEPMFLSSVAFSLKWAPALPASKKMNNPITELPLAFNELL